jgi:excisionase family DNA binding protein
MRLEDWQKWLDAQFIDAEESSLGDPEFPGEIPDEPALKNGFSEPEIGPIQDSTRDHVAVAEPEALREPDDTELVVIEAAAETFTVSATESQTQAKQPVPVAAKPAPLEPSPEYDMPVPAIEQYLPFLKSSQPTASEPKLHAEPVAASEASPAQREAAPPEKEVQKPKPEPPPPARRFGPPSHRSKRSARERSEQASTPLTTEEMWSLAPRHLKALIAMTGDEIAQHSYRREFKESRIELIQRILDPTISLEETARLLNVCPTTVRRYTNRGVLRHQRTVGDQRRFKLSDVLNFIESQSQVSTARDR